MRKLLPFLVALVIIVLSVGSCTTSTITTTTTPPPATTTAPTVTVTITTTPPITTMPPTTVPPTTIPTVTAGELAYYGEDWYDKSCTYPDCHSKYGAGAETEFSASNLARYGIAETVFGIVSNIMHLRIEGLQEDAPNQENYLEILAYMLVQNGVVQPESLFGRSSLTFVRITPQPTTTIPPTTIPVTTTAGELADLGRAVFAASCVETYCHEPWDLDGKEEFVNMRLGILW